ncbi:MAG TPA: SRPBCC domain-containing protein [Aquaticitalea sp.]|nr:SRPBCC domain-containing protein [Aquaticitalea sp.]
MKLETHKQTIEKPSQEVFDFLNDVNNLEKLMPENISKFEVVGTDGVVFALSGMPEVSLQKKEAVAPNKIIWESAGGKLNFNLDIDIRELSENKSETQFIFTGDFNAMIGMMVKGPIGKLIETWVSNIPKAI